MRRYRKKKSGLPPQNLARAIGVENFEMQLCTTSKTHFNIVGEHQKRVLRILPPRTFESMSLQGKFDNLLRHHSMVGNLMSMQELINFLGQLHLTSIYQSRWCNALPRYGPCPLYYKSLIALKTNENIILFAFKDTIPNRPLVQHHCHSP